MNHFELYDIPVSLQPDPVLVKSRFYELSRRFHPDFHGQATEEEKDDMLEKASQVNMAYKVFRDEDATIKYVLQWKGLLEEEEKYQLSPDFLMEMLELNDQAMEAATAEEKQALFNQIENIKKEIYASVAPIVANYQEGITTEKELLQVKEYYYRKKYINRILAAVQQ